MGLFDMFKKREPEIIERQVVIPVPMRPKYHTKPAKKEDPRDKVRGFTSGQDSNFTYDWFAPSTDINSMLRSDLGKTRARCRERVRNDDYAKGWVRSMVSNIIGSNGIRIQSLASYPSGNRDEAAIIAIERAWSKWAKYPQNVDISGRDNWKGILEQLVSIFAVDGEVFLRHIDGQDSGKFGYSVEIIDPALCDENLCLTLNDGNRVELGIELNKWNKPIAYYFISEQGVALAGASGSKKYLRVPAKDIVHAYKVEFAGQLRGIPPMAVSLPRMKMLADWEDSALVNAQIGASKMGFYTTNGVEDMTTGANTIEPDGEFIDELKPGQWTKLPPGYNVQKFESEYPTGEFANFKKAILRAVSTGLGIDYPSLGNDLESVNLSSARVAINETRELWKSQQQFFIDKVVTPVFERWLAQALLRKMVVAVKSGTNQSTPLKFERYEDFKAVQWLPRRWQYADPSKDTKSNIDLVNNRVKSLSTVANELGYDFETEAQLMAKDEELLNKLGLVRVDQMPDQVDPEDVEDTDMDEE